MITGYWVDGPARMLTLAVASDTTAASADVATTAPAFNATATSAVVRYLFMRKRVLFIKSFATGEPRSEKEPKGLETARKCAITPAYRFVAKCFKDENGRAIKKMARPFPHISTRAGAECASAPECC